MIDKKYKKEYILSNSKIDIWNMFVNTFEYPPDEILEQCDLKNDNIQYTEICNGFPNDTSVWYVGKEISIRILNETKLLSICVANYEHPTHFDNIVLDIQKRLNSDDIFEFGDWETYDDMNIITKDSVNQCYWAIYFESSWHSAIGRISFDELGGEDDNFMIEIGKRVTTIDDITEIVPVVLIEGKDYKFKE